MPDMVDIRRTERAPDGMGGWNARGERVVYSGLPAREGLVIEVDEIKPRSWQTAITVSGEVVS